MGRDIHIYKKERSKRVYIVDGEHVWHCVRDITTKVYNIIYIPFRVVRVWTFCYSVWCIVLNWF